MKLKLSVPQPCQEKWQNFTPSGQGGFCDSCQKEVIDFTQWREAEILAYFKNNPTGTCGRFRQDQLKTYTYTAIPPALTSAVTKYAWAPPAMISAALALSLLPAAAQAPATVAHNSASMEATPYAPSCNETLLPICIQGVVTDRAGNGLPDIVIIRKGCQQEIKTDINGMFVFQIDDTQQEETLLFSHANYTPVERVINTGLTEQNLLVMLKTAPTLNVTLSDGQTLNIASEKFELTEIITTLGFTVTHIEDMPMDPENQIPFKLIEDNPENIWRRYIPVLRRK